MKKLILTLLILFQVCSLWANDRISLDLNILSRLPEKRNQVLVKYAYSESDRVPERNLKRCAYYEFLKGTANDIYQTYYWNGEFSGDVCTGIELHARILVATQYPASSSTGCSVVDLLEQSYRIQMTESLILTMTEAIYERSEDNDIQITGNTQFTTFNEWLVEWNKSDKIDNRPNQRVELTR